MWLSSPYSKQHYIYYCWYFYMLFSYSRLDWIQHREPLGIAAAGLFQAGCLPITQPTVPNTKGNWNVCNYLKCEVPVKNSQVWERKLLDNMEKNDQTNKPQSQIKETMTENSWSNNELGWSHTTQNEIIWKDRCSFNIICLHVVIKDLEEDA